MMRWMPKQMRCYYLQCHRVLRGRGWGVVLEDRTKSECMGRVEVRALEVGPEYWDQRAMRV